MNYFIEKNPIFVLFLGGKSYFVLFWGCNGLFSYFFDLSYHLTPCSLQNALHVQTIQPLNQACRPLLDFNACIFVPKPDYIQVSFYMSRLRHFKMHTHVVESRSVRVHGNFIAFYSRTLYFYDLVSC